MPRKPSQHNDRASSVPERVAPLPSRAPEEFTPPAPLPKARHDGGLAIEQCLRTRRSTRDYSPQPLTRAELGQLLWAAQGITGLGGLRTCPSAGAIYPLRTYVIAGNITGLPPAVYKYDGDEHVLKLWRRGDFRPNLIEAACGQELVTGAAALIVFAAVYRRMLREFGDRGVRLAHIEAGHAGGNVCLQATSLGLGVIGLGAIDSEALKKTLELRAEEEPVYMMAVGRK